MPYLDYIPAIPRPRQSSTERILRDIETDMGIRISHNKIRCKFCHRSLDKRKYHTITAKDWFSGRLLSSKICSNCYRIYKLFYSMTMEKIRKYSLRKIHSYIGDWKASINVGKFATFTKKDVLKRLKHYKRPNTLNSSDFILYSEFLDEYYKLEKYGCYFCGKELKIKYIEVKIMEMATPRKMCTDCDYIFRVIYREFVSKNAPAVNNIRLFINNLPKCG